MKKIHQILEAHDIRSGVYRIHCLETGFYYVGSSANLPSRLSAHVSALKSKIHFNRKLQADFSRFGPARFTFDIMLTKPEQMRTRERMLIRRYRARRISYNGHPPKKKRFSVIVKEPPKFRERSYAGRPLNQWYPCQLDFDWLDRVFAQEKAVAPEPPAHANQNRRQWWQPSTL